MLPDPRPLLQRLRPDRRSRGPAVSWPGGVVSFSFDDFPRSALDQGGAILERHGARGTFYTALGMAGQDSPVGPLFGLEDLARAQSAGHEIACHTYSHLNCAEAAAGAIRADTRRNRDGLGRAVGSAPGSFAYPFGAVSPAAKRALEGCYLSCRGIQPGINQGRLDVGELKANRIYHGRYDETEIRGMIDENRGAGGWLIFYTHDVAAEPSAYGCLPQELEQAVAYAASRSPILPVGEVMRCIAASPLSR